MMKHRATLCLLLRFVRFSITHQRSNRSYYLNHLILLIFSNIRHRGMFCVCVQGARNHMSEMSVCVRKLYEAIWAVKAIWGKEMAHQSHISLVSNIILIVCGGRSNIDINGRLIDSEIVNNYEQGWQPKAGFYFKYSKSLGLMIIL